MSFCQHSITLLGIHMRHSAYKKEKYTFICASMQVINTILNVNRDNKQTGIKVKIPFINISVTLKAIQ